MLETLILVHALVQQLVQVLQPTFNTLLTSRQILQADFGEAYSLVFNVNIMFT